MRVLLQRVSQASVSVDGSETAGIGKGYLLLVGLRDGDSEAEAQWLASKVAGLRLFEDNTGKFNLSLLDTGGEVLVVSQFTLYGDARKGRRPSFTHAASPEIAEPLCARFAGMIREKGVTVKEGIFGARMQIALVNDGPVTMMLEREPAS